MSENRHGLIRNIPEAVKREVRQRSRFGCVVCRSAIYTYEHIDPPFAEARTHDPDHICLLCPTHQALSTKGRLPKTEIQRAYDALREDPAPERPKDDDFFRMYGQWPVFQLGSCRFEMFASIINVDGEDVLSYQLVDGDPPVRVNGFFRDEKGRELFRIRDNEWIGPVDVWDVTQVGRSLEIRGPGNRLLFCAEKIPDRNELWIKNLEMYTPPFRVFLDPNQLTVSQHAEDGHGWFHFDISHSRFVAGHCAIHLDSSKTAVPRPSGIRAVGGHGVWIEGTGIRLGRGVHQLWFSHDIRWAVEGLELGTLAPVVKTLVPPDDGDYFVLGRLETRKVPYPTWEEEEYYLDGYELLSRPNSWGIVESDGGGDLALYHVSRKEPADLCTHPGFVGFYADDLLGQPWADRVFRVMVEKRDESGSAYQDTVSPWEARQKGLRIVSDHDEAGRPHVAHHFVGSSVWKKKDDASLR